MSMYNLSTLQAKNVPMQEITMSQAIHDALAEEMRRDKTVFIIGEDVAEAGTPFKVLQGLVDEFGTERVIDAPISEPGFASLGVGAAMTGMRPVVDIMFGDFLGLVMDHDRQPGRQDPLHVGRKAQSADRVPHNHGCYPAGGSAAQPEPAGLAQPYSWFKSSAACYPVRCQGIAEDSHPR